MMGKKMKNASGDIAGDVVVQILSNLMKLDLFSTLVHDYYVAYRMHGLYIR